MLKDTITDLEFVKELSGREMSVNEQEREFINTTKKSRRTFYHYRKMLNIRYCGINYRGRESPIGKQEKEFINTTESIPLPHGYMNKDKICYFCGEQSQVIHHIDKNRENTSECNLVDLCQSCHTKLLILMSISKALRAERKFKKLQTD
jgi:hypothetical protein